MAEPDIDDFEYQLAQEAKEKALKSGPVSGGDEASGERRQGTTRLDPDGTVYEWDEEKQAWFPKIDEDFIARYQANYGFNDNKEAEASTLEQETFVHNRPKPDELNVDLTAFALKKDEDTQKNDNKRKAPSDPTWFEVDDAHNTKVYVSNLPSDITEDEFVDVMKKCGLIMKDDNNKFKIKIYRDREGNIKGDALCDYAKVESVQLALDILDGYDVKGNTISVERAKFSLKGEYDPSKKPKKGKKSKEKLKKKIDKLLDWRPDKLPGERPRSEKTVIIKNMFDPKEFENDPRLILDYKNDLRDECSEKCGEVKKVEIYDLHPEGVAAVTFNEFEDADKCVSLMNGRWFAGRQLSAASWDGRTKFKIEETEEEIEARMKKWDDYLEKE